MKSLFIFALLFSSFYAGAQQCEYVYRNTADSTINCYLACVPEDQPVRGMIIRDYSELPDISGPSLFRLLELASEQGLLTLYTVTSVRFPALFYDDSGPALLDEIVHEAVEKYKVPATNIFIGGISASGTRALRFAQYCEQGKSRYGTRIKAVFAVDPPLDIERFYRSCIAHHANFKAGMLWEADHVSPAFEAYLGAYETHKAEFRAASVFSELSPNGGNAVYYTKLPILFFHEPDIDWWISERGAAYFDINSYDIGGFVNALRLQGNDRVEIVTTSGKGFDHEGNRKCHSWTIVDEPYLLSWLLKYLD